jgi:hypothetical protein
MERFWEAAISNVIAEEETKICTKQSAHSSLVRDTNINNS